MRISDWSSDVCSSDLQVGIARAEPYEPCIDGKEQRTDAVSAQRLWQAAEQVDEEESPEREDDDVGQNHHADGDRVPARSEERRVGKEWVSTYRSRWSRDHLKKQQYIKQGTKE